MRNLLSPFSWPRQQVHVAHLGALLYLRGRLGYVQAADLIINGADFAGLMASRRIRCCNLVDRETLDVSRRSTAVTVSARLM
jgi:hypothetical protein